MNKFSNHKNGKNIDNAGYHYLTEDSIYSFNTKVASIDHETRVITRLPSPFTTNDLVGINHRANSTRNINKVAKMLGSHIGRTGNPVPYQVDKTNYK